MTAAAAFELAITAPGVYDGIPNDAYHADPVVGGSLSSSGAKSLLPPYCPAIFAHEREHPVHKDIYDFGSAAHTLILGDPEQRLMVVNADDWRTAKARAAKVEAHLTGRIPLLTKDLAKVQQMAAAVLAHPIASQLFAPGLGKPEQSLFWVDPETKVWRRGRLDWLPNRRPGRMILPDYKTAASADPETFAKAAINNGYHQQAAWYIDAVKVLELDPDPAFLFVAQEKDPPYLVSVVELDEASISVGRNLNRIALLTFKKCVESGQWPGYTDDEVQMISLPEWYLRRFDEAS